MDISLNMETIRTLASPTGDSLLVNALYLKQYHKILVSLHQLRQKLLVEASDLADRTGFNESYHTLGALPASTQKAILSYPSVACWLNTAWSLVRRQSHLRFPEMHAQMHLEEFGRIVLAAVVNAGIGEFECVTRTDARGHVILPGTGIYLEGANLIACQRLKLKICDGLITAISAGGEDEARFEVLQNRIPTFIGGIELNAVDMDLQLPGRGSFNFERLRSSDVIKWQSPLEQSLAWISECSPELAEEILMCLRVVIPVRSVAIDVHASASFREVPGLIALSWTPDASVMVEALVHEYHHQKLNSLLNLDSLIVDPSSDAIYYSPWRDDARPLLGILHGAYAFQAVLQFWKSLFVADIPLMHESRIRQRMYLLKAQVRTALNTLRSEAHLSPLGTALVEAMEENIDKQEVTLPETERAIQHRLDEVQAEHRARWNNANPTNTGSKIINCAEGYNLDSSMTENERRAVDWLRVNADFDPSTIKELRFQPDPVLNAVIFAYHELGLEGLEKILAEETSGESLLLDLIGGHVAYVLSEYERAAILYES
jgi:HEXXH motif-containing protein